MASLGLGGAKLGLGTAALGGGLDSPDRFKGIVIKVFSAARNTFPASHAVVILNGDHDETHPAISADPDRADHRLVKVAPELLLLLA